MLSGVGNLCLLSLDYGDDSFAFPQAFVDFNINSDVSSKEARGWVNGKKQVLASAIDSESYTLTLAMEFVNWQILAWAFDQRPQKVTNAVLPYTKSAIANNSGVVTDPQIKAGTKLFAYVAAKGPWGNARPLKKTEVTVSAGSFSVGAGFAAAPITYHFTDTVAEIDSIGAVTGAQKFGKLGFSGLGYGPEFPNGILIVVPEITRKSSPSFETGDVPKFSVEYGINIPQGSDSPFRFYDMSSIPPAARSEE